MVAVSTAGELCSAARQPLYKPTGTNWSSVVVQIFPGDLLRSIAVQGVPPHNDDIRKGQPSVARDARIEAIAQSGGSVRVPFAIDVRDTIALAFLDGVSACESYFMEAVCRSGKFPCAFVGGKLDFKNTFIFDGRKVIENHALIIFMRLAPGRSYSVFKSQNFKKTGQSFVVMGADPDGAQHPAYWTAGPMRFALSRRCSPRLKTTPADVMSKKAGHSFGIEVGGDLLRATSTPTSLASSSAYSLSTVLRFLPSRSVCKSLR